MLGMEWIEGVTPIVIDWHKKLLQVKGIMVTLIMEEKVEVRDSTSVLKSLTGKGLQQLLSNQELSKIFMLLVEEIPKPKTQNYTQLLTYPNQNLEEGLLYLVQHHSAEQISILHNLLG